MGVHVFPSKNSRTSSKERKFVLGGMPKRPPPRHKYRKKLNVFYINITSRQQFFISVGESTKIMLKQRFPNFFPDHITNGAK